MVDMFSDAPQLRRVTLDNTFLSAIALPWARLTHLRVSWVSIDECAEMLRRCPCLVECDFSRILSNAEFHPLPPRSSASSSSPIVLPSLRSLSWSYAGDAWEFQLFGQILFPNLGEFKLKLRYDVAELSLIVLVLRAMLGGTSPRVERLELDLACPWADLYEVLREVKGVRVLRLVDEQDEQMVRKVMEALLVTSPRQGGGGGGQGWFLPRLRVLEWRGHCWMDLGMVKWVLEKAKARWEMGRGSSSSELLERLERVVLAMSSGHLLGLKVGERWVSDEVRALEEMGMHVVIVHRQACHEEGEEEGGGGGGGEGWLD